MAWSKTRLKAVGKALVVGQLSADQRADLDELLILADHAALEAEVRVQSLLNSTWPTHSFFVKGRAKSKETLAEKLTRMGPHMLPIIRDLAGIRVVGDINRREQDQVLVDVCGTLVEEYETIDRRRTPSFGYRALHAELVFNGGRMEVQVRTQLQHIWADAYEKLGDQIGRAIRYHTDLSALSTEDRIIVQQMQQISDAIDVFEQQQLLLLDTQEMYQETVAELGETEEMYQETVAELDETEDMAGQVKEPTARLDLSSAEADEIRVMIAGMDASRERIRGLRASADTLQARAKLQQNRAKDQIIEVISTLKDRRASVSEGR